MAAPLLVGPRAGLTDALPVGGVEPVRVPVAMVAGVTIMAVGEAAGLGAPSGAPLGPSRRARPGVTIPLGGHAGEAPGEPREAARVARRGQGRHQASAPVLPVPETAAARAPAMVGRGRQRARRDEAHPATVRANHVEGRRHHPGGVRIDHARASASAGRSVADTAGTTPRWPSHARPRPARPMDQEEARHR